jgi:hypothetical protein
MSVVLWQSAHASARTLVERQVDANSTVPIILCSLLNIGLSPGLCSKTMSHEAGIQLDNYKLHNNTDQSAMAIRQFSLDRISPAIQRPLCHSICDQLAECARVDVLGLNIKKKR